MTNILEQAYSRRECLIEAYKRWQAQQNSPSSINDECYMFTPQASLAELVAARKYLREDL